MHGVPFPKGEDVEVIVLSKQEHSSGRERYPLRGSVVAYDDPFGSVAEDDWEVFQEPS